MAQEKSITRRVIGIILDVVLLLMVLYVGVTLYLRHSTGNPHASIFGITTHVVISESMEPNVHKSDVIIVKKCDSYAVGDVVTYIAENGMSITHRVIEVTLDGYVVKGDNNEDTDPPISAEQIVGKMIFRLSL